MTLAEYLAKFEMTQEAFANKSGIAQAAVCRHARGRSVPDVRNRLRIQRATDGMVDALNDWPEQLGGRRIRHDKAARTARAKVSKKSKAKAR